MIDLERNSKKQLVVSKGKRTRESSIYKPYQKENFKISRGRFSDFLSCPRCFYLDRIRGLKPPGTPGWTLNETTDFLLKKEFDECRKKQIPHRLFSKYGLNDVVPFRHKDIDKWRNSLNAGLQVQYKNSNIILTGGIDDVWIDLNSQELIVVDYKSQAKTGYVEQKDYLEDPYHHGYKIQMDFYAYLLIQMGFKVKDTSYFLVCNANRTKNGFYGQMEFDEYLIPYKWNVNWIDKKVDEMIYLMNQHEIPQPNLSCNNCAYSNQYSLSVKNHIKPLDENNHNLNNKTELKEKNQKITYLEERLETLINQKKAVDFEKERIDKILSDPHLLSEHVSQFFRDDGPNPFKQYFSNFGTKNLKVDIDNLTSSLKESQSMSNTYAEILSDPQLLKEYYVQFFDKVDDMSENNESNLKDFVSVVSPVKIEVPDLKEEHFGVIIRRSEDNLHTILTSYEIWGGSGMDGNRIDSPCPDEEIKITTCIDNKVHKASNHCLLDDIHSLYPDLSFLYFYSEKNYISQLDDYLNIKIHSSKKKETDSLVNFYASVFNKKIKRKN